MEAAIIIGLVVWFIASIPQSIQNNRNRKAREEREEREWQRECELAEHLERNGDPLKLLAGLRDKGV